MSAGKNTEIYQALRCEKEDCKESSIELIGEEPLLIHFDEKPYSVVMRTPGEEVFHAAGLCLGEGIVDTVDDFKTIGYDSDLDPNIIDIWLTPERYKKIQHILNRKTYVSQTSCGICGKKMMEDLNSVLAPADNGLVVKIDQIFDCVRKLSKTQNYYPRTRGSHAALLFDEHLKMISFAEDVGRHNALDKAIGKAFMDRTLPSANLLVLSSRISYELVQKAARAQVPMIISKSRPTALAVKMAQGLNMTLACAFGESKLLTLCGKHRIKKE
ncbi:MAG: formate dehydrogenase accessory sulfurtransferase FdhD [Deltaproteobacteria bacterium]|nr:MAG: formate dehydrogenase accessory sulfurtransferase FdhD [Deltaproteobacteria bacterium]RLC16404.1 MAG: formate dehydrogenase accessory sulfurtransferase FdhD [Deltaproteobacteria bacterium]